MDNDLSSDEVLVLFGVRLVQPGRLDDVAQGVFRLSGHPSNAEAAKGVVRKTLVGLKDKRLVDSYPVGRYVLTEKGNSLLEASGIKAGIDSRRFFLLKETRKLMKGARSDARARPL